MDNRRTYRGRQETNVTMAIAVAVVMLILVAVVLVASGFFNRDAGSGSSRENERQEQQAEGTESSTAEKPAEASQQKDGETESQAKGKPTSEYAESDRLRITGGLAQAEQSAKAKNYAAALNTLKTLLDDYPDSAELQDKYDEIAAQLAEQTAAEEKARKEEEEKAAATKKMASPDGSCNVRKEPDFSSEAVAVIQQGEEVTFDGQIKQGPGSSGATRDWLHVTTAQGVEGWVVSDLLAEVGASPESTQAGTADGPQTAGGSDLSEAELNATYLTLVPKTNISMRSNASDDSTALISLTPADALQYYGWYTTGPGSDGNTHYWCAVVYGGTQGFVRSDQVSVQR